MKKLFVILALLLTVTAVAKTVKTIPMPAYMKGATIAVMLADGTEYEFKAEQYAVVPRTQEVDDAVDAPLAKGKGPFKPNAVKVYGGGMAAGIKSATVGGTTTVDQAYGFNYGFGYGRKLSDEISLEGIVIMNNNGPQGGLLGIGYNW